MPVPPRRMALYMGARMTAIMLAFMLRIDRDARMTR